MAIQYGHPSTPGNRMLPSREEFIQYLKTLSTGELILVGARARSNATRNLCIIELVEFRGYSVYSCSRELALTESVVRNQVHRYRKSKGN